MMRQNQYLCLKRKAGFEQFSQCGLFRVAAEQGQSLSVFNKSENKRAVVAGKTSSGRGMQYFQRQIVGQRNDISSGKRSYIKAVFPGCFQQARAVAFVEGTRQGRQIQSGNPEAVCYEYQAPDVIHVRMRGQKRIQSRRPVEGQRVCHNIPARIKAEGKGASSVKQHPTGSTGARIG